MKIMGMLLASALLYGGAAAWTLAAEPTGGQPAPDAARQSEPSQPDQSAARAVSDAPALREKIETALQKEPSLKNDRIDVILRQCHVDEAPARCNVTLTGTVESQVERATAERVARIKGVVLIDNRIELAETAPAATPATP